MSFEAQLPGARHECKSPPLPSSLVCPLGEMESADLSVGSVAQRRWQAGEVATF